MAGIRRVLQPHAAEFAGLRGLIVALSLPLACTVCLINGYLWPFWPLEQLWRKYIVLFSLDTEVAFSKQREKNRIEWQALQQSLRRHPRSLWVPYAAGLFCGNILLTFGVLKEN